MSEPTENKTFYTTGVVTIIYPHLVETEKFQGADTGNYSATFIINDEAEYNRIMSKVNAVAKIVHGSKRYSNPVRSTDYDNEGELTSLLERGAGEGWSFKASTKYKIDYVDRNPATRLSADEFYPGLKVRAHLSIAAYEVPGKRGVKFYLQGLQKVQDGPRLNLGGGGGNPFSNLDDPSNNSMVPAAEEEEIDC